jgi:dipeptidyl aminopeptidase/acylaminoacyl peptidase
MKRKIYVIVLALVVFALSTCRRDGASSPAVAAEDYARAEQWLPVNTAKMVRNIFVVPQWIGKTDTFWYRRQTADGHEFVVVDASTGKKEPAFDHKAMADALTSLGVKEVKSAALPFDAIEFTEDRSAITFAVESNSYSCTLTPFSCKKQPEINTPDGLIVSPDGSRGVFARGGNLWLRDMDSGAERPLTSDGEEHHGYGIYYGNWKASYIPNKRAGKPLPPMETEWSPGSSRVLVTKLDERHVEPYPFIETAPDDGSFRPKVHWPRVPITGEKPATLEWFVIDVDSGQKVRLNLPYEKLFFVHQDMLAIRETWWSDDESHLYSIAWGDNLEFAVVYDIDLATGEPRVVIEESIQPRTDTNSTSYNPPNVRVLGNCDEVIWFSQRTGWGHLYLYDGQTGKQKNAITSGEWLVRDILHVDEINRRIFFSAGGREPGSPYDRYLYRVDFDGSNLTMLSPEPADHMLTSPWNDILGIDGAFGYKVVSPSGEYVVYNYSRVNQPTKTVIRRVSDGGLVAQVEEADAGALYEAGWRDPEEFVVRAADGETDLYGVIYLPPNLDKSRKYPVIDSQYASPLTAVVPRNFMMAIYGVPALVKPACLAELGFVCVAVDARGTTYRSKKFSHYSWQNLNTDGLEDHVAAIRKLAESRPWMDIERVGIHGDSYGGYATFRAMLEFPEFYKVGASGCGEGTNNSAYPDYHFFAFHGKPVYADGSHLRPDATAKPINYTNLDGPVQADRLKGKLLIQLGELDENVFPATTLQFVDALIKADKDFDMVYYPNRAHSFGGPFAVRKVWDYFVEHLMGVEPPPYQITSWKN